MKLPPVTEWFSSQTPPARTGVYETRDSDDIRSYQHWNGKFWGFFMFDVDDAYLQRECPSYQQFNEWRGLSSDPSKATEGE